MGEDVGYPRGLPTSLLQIARIPQGYDQLKKYQNCHDYNFSSLNQFHEEKTVMLWSNL